MFKVQRCLATTIKRSFASRKNFTGRYKVAKEEKYEGIKNKAVHGKAMKKGLEHDPDLEFNDYLELETDYNQTYTPESDETKNRKLQSFLDSKTSIEDKLKGYLSEAKNDKEMLYRSEKLVDSIRRKDVGSLFADENQEILDEYDRYAYYKKNYVDKTDNHEMKLKDEENLLRDRDNHHTDGINDFYRNLDSDITKHMKSEYVAKNLDALTMLKGLEEKINLISLHRETKVTEPDNRCASEAELTDLQRKLMSEFENTAEKSKNTVKGPSFEKQYVKAANKVLAEDTIEQAEQELDKPNVQLSLRSKIEIHKLYLQGWSIKDICLRFGVSPHRAKYAVWNMQYFIEDVLPFLTPEQVIERIYLELNPDEDTEVVDYGVDLENLNQFQGGTEVRVMAKNLMDHIPKTNKEAGLTEEEIDKKIQSTKTKREDYVIEKVVSTGSPPYYLKNWIVYSGQGMMRVNRMFKKIVERSHYKGHLPLKATARLDKGPRIASLGYGIK